MAIKLIEEEDHGLYIWVTDDGAKVVDEEGRTMNIASKRGDRTKIEALRQAARYYGFPNGKAVFLSNKRQVTDSEWEYQMERFKAGLVPDPLDFRAMQEEAKYAKRHG